MDKQRSQSKNKMARYTIATLVGLTAVSAAGGYQISGCDDPKWVAQADQVINTLKQSCVYGDAPLPWWSAEKPDLSRSVCVFYNSQTTSQGGIICGPIKRYPIWRDLIGAIEVAYLGGTGFLYTPATPGTTRADDEKACAILHHGLWRCAAAAPGALYLKTEDFDKKVCRALVGGNELIQCTPPPLTIGEMISDETQKNGGHYLKVLASEPLRVKNCSLSPGKVY